MPQGHLTPKEHASSPRGPGASEPVGEDRSSDEYAESEYIPQRLAEDRIPYKGPAITTREIRIHHILLGVGLFIALALTAIIAAWSHGPIR